jgi:hypothetical protein
MRRKRTRGFEGGTETGILWCQEAVGALSFESKPVQE